MNILESFLGGEWVAGDPSCAKEVRHAINGSVVSLVSAEGIDMSGPLVYAKDNGYRLRQLTIHQRALLVKKVAKHLFDNKEAFYAISYQTGATKSDSWIDIEGGINTAFALSSLARKALPDSTVLAEPEVSVLSKGGSFIGQHILTSKTGVALHINSFNFPCWGMLEKLASNFIAGVPAIVKPATDSAYLTQAMVKSIIEADILPKGALQIICGATGNLLDLLDYQDTVTFTGSLNTANIIRNHPNIVNNSVRVNIEADSLNACVLGSDVTEQDPEFDLFINEIAQELSTKAGQRCTCIRRIFVPKHLEQGVIAKLTKTLSEKKTGDPKNKEVTIGALISKKQVLEVDKAVKILLEDSECIYKASEEFMAEKPEEGAFYPVTLLKANSHDLNANVHSVEAFGPVSSLLEYSEIDELIMLINAGKGSLVTSIFSNDLDFIKDVTLKIANSHGRLLIVNRDNAAESTGHGTVMPHMVHGGPGRAGGGEELGGIRSLDHYMQRTAIQASPDILTKITGQWVKGSSHDYSEQHPFKKYYEDLNPGDSLSTHRRTVTETDIVQFGCLSGDHFYAHFDAIAAKESIFKDRVAHGYFIISAAAGLFVYPKEGPVLANYGLDNLRFIDPVYIGDTIQVKLTFVRKNMKPKVKGEKQHGVVYWDVEVFNQDNKVVANYQILTLVATRGGLYV